MTVVGSVKVEVDGYKCSDNGVELTVRLLKAGGSGLGNYVKTASFPARCPELPQTVLNT